MVCMQDITEEKVLSAAVEKSEKYLSALINSTQDLFWMADADLILITYNKTYSRIIEMITKKGLVQQIKPFHFL